MRLTVGPLPAAVYWRRRAVVLVGLAMVVLVISYACGSGDGQVAGAGTRPTATTTPSPTPALQRSTTPSAKPVRSTYTLPPAAGATGPCSDLEMRVTATAATATVQRGQPVDVTIKIKNMSQRTCGRDIGADMQELRLLDGAGYLVWSSDDCNANKGRNVQSFAPGRQVSYTLTWNGRRSRTGVGVKTCVADAPTPAGGTYQLVARLDQKVSEPFSLRIRD